MTSSGWLWAAVGWELSEGEKFQRVAVESAKKRLTAKIAEKTRRGREENQVKKIKKGSRTAASLASHYIFFLSLVVVPSYIL